MARFILPTLAFAGAVFAQCSGPITISTSSDAAALESCSTYTGDVTIDSSATGTISLDGVGIIDGDLTCNNATGLNSLSATQLQTITGTFMLSDLTVLSTLSFASLRQVANINWVGLPALQSLNFPIGVQESNQVLISNTQLNDLSGIELSMVGSMDINNNPFLNEINVNSLTNITNALSFSANGMNLDVSFPNLQNAGNLTFRNVSSVEVPSLSTVGGSIGLYSDYFLNFSAPNLSTIGQALAIIDCASLNMISFPELTFIGGGFIIVNNTNLKAINNIPQLKTIGGAIDFIGSFDDVEAPGLKDVRGGSTVETSSSNQTICNIFNKAASNQIIKGHNSCTNSVASPQTNGTTTNGGGSSSSSHNAAPVVGFNPAIPFTSFAGLLVWMLF